MKQNDGLVFLMNFYIMALHIFTNRLTYSAMTSWRWGKIDAILRKNCLRWLRSLFPTSDTWWREVQRRNDALTQQIQRERHVHVVLNVPEDAATRGSNISLNQNPESGEEVRATNEGDQAGASAGEGAYYRYRCYPWAKKQKKNTKNKNQ